MTALVVVGVLVLIGVIALAVWTGYLRTVRAGALLNLAQAQKSVILKIEKEALMFGMSDPLASVIINIIHEARTKENS